jgi:subtilisin family serine protease
MKVPAWSLTVVVFTSPLGVFDDAGNGQYTSGNLRSTGLLNEGADVINMSLGGGGFFQTGQNLFNKAHALASFRRAAGNNGSTQSYPASYDKVISVAAVDQEKKRASLSQQ